MPSAPLRVLYLTPYYRPYLGGIERAIEELSHQIQQSPQVEAVGVLTTKYSFPRVAQPDWPDRETLPDGVQVYRLPGFPRWSVPLYSVPLVWFSPRRMRQYLEEFQPDVVHFVGDGWFWGHYWTKVRWKRTGAVRVHAFLPHPAVDAVVAGPDQRIALPGGGRHRAAHAAGGPRPAPRLFGPRPKDAHHRLGRSTTRSRYHRVRCAWRPDPRSRVREDASPQGQPVRADGGADGTVTILCVGRLGRHKAQLWLLEAYRQARGEFNKPVRLVLVGRDEGDADSIAEFVEGNGMSDEVVVPGEVTDEELARWYARADLFVLFSHYEAFGLVYFEAMAYGLPVLTHDVGSNRELLHRGAVVTARFDRRAAANSLVELVNDDAGRRVLSEEARDYALSEFTWPTVAEKYLELYLGGRVAPGTDTPSLQCRSVDAAGPDRRR